MYVSASLTVTPASAISIAISPKIATVASGSAQTFTAAASDSYGNTWDCYRINIMEYRIWCWGILGLRTLTLPYKAGLWTVTGTLGSLSASAMLNVTHSLASSISLTPKSTTISAGTSQTFIATASDNNGNTWDVSNLTSWNVSTGAGGSWSNNTYTSAEAGIWTITGTYGNISSTASLTVGYCLTFKILISPKTSTLTAGSSEAFTAEASDIYGNVWNVTSLTTWSIDNGAGGSWLKNTYTSSTSGVWTVTGTYQGISGTGTITVNNGLPVQIVVGVPTGSQTAGSSATFTSIAIDNCNNAWVVSNQTSWNISSGAGGSWSGNVYTSAMAGTWTVTGTYGGKSNSGSLTIIPASPISIAIAPKTSTLSAGSSQVFTATATDNYGNTWYVSSATLWTISPGASGSWSNNVYTSAKANSWLVTGNFTGLIDIATLTVTHGSATSILASPKASTIVAGTTQAFGVTAFDTFGNSWDSTASASFKVDPQASGSLSGNVYTSCNSGTWSVTATSLSLTDTASLTVTHSSPIGLDVSPDSTSITAGQNQIYNATASDTYGNIWDVTSSTVWNVNSRAGGGWSHNVYMSANAGSWTITGSYSGLSDFAYITVNHASLISVKVSPKNAIISAGSNEAFTATGSDQYGNQWDISNSATWNISTGAGGSWTNSIYTSANTGNWTITTTLNGLQDTASLTVNHGTVLGLTITPSSTSIVAGQSQVFTATASDSNGNNWVVTNSTTWNINSGAGGSWSGNNYTSNNAGTWTVTGTYLGSSKTALVTVNDGPAVSITVGSTSQSATAGSSQDFTATASDSYGNTWDVTASTVWTIDDGAGGSWSGNTYTSALSGTWNVTGTINGLSKSIFLTVSHNTALSIQITPYNVSISAGINETYTATAFDSFGNSWDVTSSAIWSVNSSAGGSWLGNVYTAAQAGTWTITATVANLQTTAPITVNHGSINVLSISPKSQTLTSGSPQAFTATAYDSSSNSWDVTALTVWSIDSNASGSWSNNVYTPAKAGNWIVIGTFSGFSDNSQLTVNHGSPLSIIISPTNASITSGSPQAYTATASDSGGNTWDITNTTSWTTDSGAGGNWTGNIYNSANSGNWTVAGIFAGITGTAQLTVNSTSQQASNSWLDLNHDGVVNMADILYFINAYQDFGSKGTYDSTCDFNHDGQINFQDLVIYIMAYIIYQHTA